MATNLNDKQKRFAKEYIVDLNATQAAIRAGYSVKTAGAIGFKLLKKAEIQAQIQKNMDKRANRTDITADKVLNELALMAFADTTDLVKIDTDKEGDQYVALRDTNDLTDDQKRMIAGIKQGANGIEIKTHDKLRALEMLGKHLKLFTEKTEVEHAGNVKVMLNIPRPKREKTNDKAIK